MEVRLGPKTPEELAAFIEQLKAERKAKEEAKKEISREKRRESNRKWVAANSDRKRESNRKWVAANPERVREIQRKRYAADPERMRTKNRTLYWKDIEKSRESGKQRAIKRNYGLSKEEWEIKFEQQGRCCGICETTKPNGRNWHTDHCDKTGMNRDILCQTCNLTIANHSVEYLRKCADYVEKWLKLHSN